MKMEEVAWAGRFPIVRGGVATFTLQPQAPFMISVRAEATMSPRGARHTLARFNLQGKAAPGLGPALLPL